MHQRPYERLVAWREAHQLCLMIYQLTQNYPKDEKFGLVSQMRRSAYSAPTNIAEGNAKHSCKERAHFFEIAIASLEELHYQLRLSLDLHYIDAKNHEQIVNNLQKSSYLLMRLRSAIV